MRVLSGIQPTGRFHWGNYFGAIRQYIDLQHEDAAFYFIANLHALNAVREPDRLRQLTLEAAIDLLALGLNPDHANLFVQSDVPEVSQLCWLLMTGTPMGLLERCHAYKDKISKGLAADAGLFTYPVLMAADILAYDSDTVPVGADQVQHIEVCRDIAASFNHHFGETFIMPKAKVLEHSAKVPGIDGEKMSKSYNNTLEVFEDPKAQRKKIMRIVTDSRPMDRPKEPADDHLFQLYSLVATDPERNDMAALYRRGGFGYGEVKKALADAADRFFAEPRSRRADLAAQPDRVRDILADGASRAEKKPLKSWHGLRRHVESIAKMACASRYQALGARSIVAGSALAVAIALARVSVSLQEGGVSSPLLSVLFGCLIGGATVALAQLLSETKLVAVAAIAAVAGLCHVTAEHLFFYRDYRAGFEQIAADTPEMALARTVADVRPATFAEFMKAGAHRQFHSLPMWMWWLNEAGLIILTSVGVTKLASPRQNTKTLD